ncbi:MAG: FHA domain-containing protein [Acidobacteriota bacterium]
MADPRDSVLDRAETLARRILERLGSKVDSKIASDDKGTLSARIIGDLTSRIERVIESTLKKDQHGIRNVAPNRFKVLFTYEETSALSPQYIEAVGKELTPTVFEYINNRRYATRGPVEVQAGQDLFAKALVVKASFDGDTDQSTAASQTNPAAASQAASVSRSQESKRLCFNSSDGRRYQIDLKLEGAPAYIGRAAGNAVRIDDPSVSRLHCSLSLGSGGGALIADVGSVNGTYVNEHLLGRDEARPLQTGDVVGVGDFKLTVSEIS